MSRDKIPYLLSILILLASSVFLYQNDGTISGLEKEIDQLTQDISVQTQEVQALTDQVLQISETAELLNNSLTTTLESIEAEKELDRSTYAQVLSVERIIYAYMFDEKVNCTFSVHYSFPEPTETVFLVLDTDKITVLGHEELNLEGIGIATVDIEITLPEESGKWSVSPSVYWMSDGAPKYSDTQWRLETSFEVLDVDPGHSQGSCGEESVACHDSLG
ncbi:hypothetical protein HOB36_04745 [Candidatus Bathyarchaeota archaeon]|nr:hypothetical protein [Candidatus Bathyarchaeota archaeon]